MNYEKQRRRLEKDGAEWFDTLKKLKSLTTSIINNETLDILEYTDMRDNLRTFLTIMEHHLNELKIKKKKRRINYEE